MRMIMIAHYNIIMRMMMMIMIAHYYIFNLQTMIWVASHNDIGENEPLLGQ